MELVCLRAECLDSDASGMQEAKIHGGACACAIARNGPVGGSGAGDVAFLGTSGRALIAMRRQWGWDGE